MEHLSIVCKKLRGVAKSGQDLLDGLFSDRESSTRRNPIEILKRLQREAFSDLMKLRDRQDKVERMLSFYKPSRGSPFQGVSTTVKAQVNVLGALLMMDKVDQQNLDLINKAGIRTGTESRIIFETTSGEKDSLVAEFVASQKGEEYVHDFCGSPLSLAKVVCTADFSDSLSAVAIPVGAQCRDVGTAVKSYHQVNRLRDFSSFGPPLLSLRRGTGFGITVRKSNVVASLAQFFSGLGMSSNSNYMENGSSTFGQVICELPGGSKLSLSCLRHRPSSLDQPESLGGRIIPMLATVCAESPETAVETSVSPLAMPSRCVSRSIAAALEAEFDEIARIGCWMEMNNTNSRSVHWGMTMSDVSDDFLGWGLSLGGTIGGWTSNDHFQAESHVKFNLGNGFSLNPGLTYVTDGNSKVGGLIINSNWSF